MEKHVSLLYCPGNYCLFQSNQKNSLDVSGFMQFVQSVPVAEVLATEGNIQVSRNIQYITYM